MKTCIVCAGNLSGRQQRFCSRPCSIKGYTQARVASGRAATCQAGQRMRTDSREQQRQWAQEWRQRHRRQGVCAHCGHTFDCAMDHPEQIYCSKRCARQPQARVIRPTLVAGRCVRCGNHYTVRFSGTSPKYCSRTCSNGDKFDRRRAMENGVELTPGRRYEVFERDAWTCRICGDPVNRFAVVPELDAPTVDHIIALARGGAHGPDNWQTAHFYCNSVKSDSDLCLI